MKKKEKLNTKKEETEDKKVQKLKQPKETLQQENKKDAKEKENTKKKKSIKKQEQKQQKNKEQQKETKKQESEEDIKEENETKALAKIDIKSKEILDKISKEIKRQKQVSENKMKITQIIITKNIIIAAGIILYFMFFKIAYIQLDLLYFVKLVNAFSIITMVCTIIIFEVAYKKDNDMLAINGIEFMFLAITTLLIKFAHMEYKQYFIMLLTVVPILYAIYYLAKSIRFYIKTKKKFKNNALEIKDIVKTKK